MHWVLTWVTESAEKAAQDQSDGCENGGTDEEIVRLLKHVFESAGAIECEEKTITK